MAGFELQLKERAKGIQILLKKGVKIVGNSCKKVSQFHARPSSALGFRAQNTLESSFRTLGTMLPKGQPVPPSGPSQQIN
ncbi:hypothetical protein V6N11_028096 [Hibiscus sabdariffa]|uniref:Uncharacterized protein n=1 Tax=Hibiscus sabdariffa TaxID=183260 RepID=A0ABR2NZQ6_9ROSI